MAKIVGNFRRQQYVSVICPSCRLKLVAASRTAPGRTCPDCGGELRLAEQGEEGHGLLRRAGELIDFTVSGIPRGKGRPRFVRATGRTYTDAQTVEAEGDVVGAWARAGEIRLEDVPLQLNLTAVLERPKGHWKRDGTLSASGTRSAWPTRKPDWDNIGKLVADALNGKAYRDDAQIVHVVLWKRWANPGETCHTRVRLWPMGRPA